MSLRTWWRGVRKPLFQRLVYALVAGVGRTLRFTAEGAHEGEKRIYCGWHGKSFPFTYFFRGRGCTVIISESNDGDVQNVAFARLGFRTIRGSTGRNGERALIAAIRTLRAGGTMAMTPDGPRGPSAIVQPGVVAMAQKSGAVLVPVGIAIRPARRFGSWDRYALPLPGARVLILFGEAIPVPPKATDEEFEAARLRLQEEINRLENESASRMGLPPEIL